MKNKRRPRLVIEIDEDFKNQVQDKARAQRKTVTKVVLDFLKKWVKK